ncbi:B- and T-lymphocyte attenuator isoform X1 [Pelodiscus sinensis]|uniref:B- and T-lymphocyte attenuator isoform X1 n=1 Tax=Pelodiscus sinensis TaxID=13735 RepID=UPI003F6D8895
MKTPPGMQANRTVLHILLLVLSLGNCKGDEHVTTNCTTELQVIRGYKFQSKSGDSLTITCPVKYCTEKPTMTWCKIKGQECLRLNDGPTKNATWIQQNVFSLKFTLIHQNDSGLYRCRATVGGVSSESHAVVVIVSEVATDAPTNPPTKDFSATTNVTGDPQRREDHNKKWIIYILSSLGGLCLFILICLCLFCCLRRHQVKPKTTLVTSQQEMNMVHRVTGSQCHNDRLPPTPCEESALYYCSMASQQQPANDSTIYDKHIPHWNSSRAAAGTTCESTTVGPYQPSPESHDVLVYASLNHSAMIEKLPKKEPDVKIELTEYATICVKK